MEKKDVCIVEFGLAVKRLREKEGFSQEGFAAHAEIHRTYMGGIERGERNPTLTTIYKIAKALGLNPQDIFNEIQHL